jgi:NAD(P)-dependent dehydrogenase (short-subunit alcohol dehydrogenase family)
LDISAAAAAENASELLVKCDVSSEADVSDAVGKVLQHWGSLDILVNCAGVMDIFGT